MCSGSMSRLRPRNIESYPAKKLTKLTAERMHLGAAKTMLQRRLSVHPAFPFSSRSDLTDKCGSPDRTSLPRHSTISPMS
jgi:hypothetical protein